MDPGLLVFAFAAGAVAFFAPCCIAMLPAYVGYAVRSPTTTSESPVNRTRNLTGRVLLFAGAVPFLAGMIPLLMRGASIVIPISYSVSEALPGPDTSLALAVIGSAVLAVSLHLLGKGPSALRGALFGSLATLGFFVVFLILGLPIAFLASGLAPYMDWLAVFVGILLVGLGIVMLTGFSFAPRLPVINADVNSPRGFFLFGIGYGIASLSCTFPIFLAVLAAGAVSGGITSSLAVFAAFSLGKAVLLVAVTVLTVVGGTTMGSQVKRFTPFAMRASGVIIIISGLYIAYYFSSYAPSLF